MEELNLVITSPEESQLVKQIVWNRAEFEEAIGRVVKDYKGVAYTEEMVGQAKKDKATLNKLSKAIDDRRKQVKKAIMEPYDTFEKELNEAKAQLNEAINGLDDFVKAFERQEQEKKRFTLELYYRKAAFGLDDVITFEDVFDKKWLNATVSLRKAQAELDGAIEKVRSDLKMIDELDEQDRPTAKNTYYRCHDIAQAMADAARVRRIREDQERKNETEYVNETIDKMNSKGENNDVDTSTGNTHDSSGDALGKAAEIVDTEEPRPVEVVNAIRSATFSTSMSVYQAEIFAAKARELGIEADIVADVRVSGTEQSIHQLAGWMRQMGIGFGSVGRRGQA